VAKALTGGNRSRLSGLTPVERVREEHVLKYSKQAIGIAMIAKDLPAPRFWAIWLIFLILACGVSLPAIIHALRGALS
jgi:hypothetical protein